MISSSHFVIVFDYEIVLFILNLWLHVYHEGISPVKLLRKTKKMHFNRRLAALKAEKETIQKSPTDRDAPSFPDLFHHAFAGECIINLKVYFESPVGRSWESCAHVFISNIISYSKARHRQTDVFIYRIHHH